MTVRQAYEAAVDRLKDAGFNETDARSGARILLDNFAKTSHAHLTISDQALCEDDYPKQFFDNVMRLRKGEPLAHVLQQREFFGLPFLCDNRALIPRSETELVVENAIERLKNCESPLIADLGTGSGCIAVSLAHTLKKAVVYATDLSLDALELARNNAQRHGVAYRIEFVEGQSGEWAQPLVREGFAGMFRCIVSNPPYISKRDIEELAPQIKDHEPRMALDGGDDGLTCYRDMARQCGVLLQPDGFLLAELGAGQFPGVRLIFESEGWNVAPPIYDLAGHERVLSATRRD
ncbi:MAG TPA: peptide chain release factor N(5)-glutamine methyltransferase [Abditibacteriaceae bacterium]|nr:peptide chain release factor N(5)-glutamine methyltransferase [Abditibacteriaceae bacterium]